MAYISDDTQVYSRRAQFTIYRHIVETPTGDEEGLPTGGAVAPETGQIWPPPVAVSIGQAG